jgi:hypothetical protein
MLNASKPEHRGIKERIIRHNIPKRPMMYERKLEDFDFELQGAGVDELLNNLTDKNRLKRGREIKDVEFIIEELSQDRIKAKIRQYRIEVNLGEKVLKHDCDDWRKGLGIKRICKHVVKLFMTISEEESRGVLKDILENKDDWRFLL